MTSEQREQSDSTEPSPRGISSEATQYDKCKACPFGEHPNPSEEDLDPLHRPWSFEYDYKAVKESAERGNCQACAGTVKFFNAKKIEPESLEYINIGAHGMTVGLRGGNITGCRERYEFFAKQEEPGDEGDTIFDLYSRFYSDWNIYRFPHLYADFYPELYLKSSVPELPIPRLRAPSGDTSSEAAFDTLKNWIYQCEEYHEQCNVATDERLPHRVLEIMSSEPLRVRLVEDCTQIEAYACLSHRWARQTKRNSLKKRNLDLYKREVPEDNLYPLVRDAMVATSRLGLHFIWIDCYCIIQDDIKDWEAEAAEMANIYENAYLTLAATSAKRGHSMFSTMARKFEAFQITEIRGVPVYIRPQLRHPLGIDYGADEEYFDSPLLTRAWVFQERLLSRRFIHFTSNEIFWECRESTWCECESRNKEWQELREQTPRTIGGQDWDYIAHQYTQTELTFEKDRLPALAGVARRYSELRGGWTYLAGLWKEQLLSGLAWCKPYGCDVERPRKQVAPTWSWASLPLAGNYSSSFLTGSMPLLGCRIIPHNADVYSGVKRIEITVEGPTLDLEVYKLSDGSMIGRHQDGFFRILADFKTDPDDDVKYRAVRNGSRCKLLLLMEDDPEPDLEHVFGIVLLRADGDLYTGDERSSGKYAGSRRGSQPTNSSVYSGGKKFERIGCIDEISLCDSFVDLSGEYAGYRGGDLKHPAEDGQSRGCMTIGWLRRKGETEKVTLV